MNHEQRLEAHLLRIEELLVALVNATAGLHLALKTRTIHIGE